ncbi:hypothetical protein QC761_202610 [Podospora bellae-mahoneyi]|uniref:2EXR domain-containing protein n=1 Tax=Podospora bellae-mahoneyi TaxID=2093777 RepID=A0ABR0FNL7_9PEZI|nr:hypothetical protein QC761_202610 [Podospora bellae-mahoneyi]
MIDHHLGQETAQILSSSCSSVLLSSSFYRLSLCPVSTTVPSAVSITLLGDLPLVTTTTTPLPAKMLDPLYGLATLSSWTPTFDPSSTTIITTTTTLPEQRDPSMLDNSSSSDCYWIRLFLKVSILCGWFSERIRSYARLCQEACQEQSEERRLWTLNPDHPSSSLIPIHSSSLLRPLPRGSPTTFPKFRLLPAELRQQIWAEALPKSRIMLLQLPKQNNHISNLTGDWLHKFSSRPRRDTTTTTSTTRLARGRSFSSREGEKYSFATTSSSYPSSKSNIFTCSTPPPVLLSVCSESRLAALKRYRLGLAPRGHPQPRIYVDLSTDVIGLSNEVMSSTSGKNLIRLTPDMRLVRHVCLAGQNAGGFMSSRGALVLDSVESLVVVENGLFGSGMVPRVAGLDWEYWVRWQCRKGLARFGFGGERFGVRGGVSTRETWEGKGFGMG